MKANTPMNLALACALALAGCAKSPITTAELVGGPMLEMRQAVDRNVADPSRQTQLLALVGELDGVLQAHSRDLNTLSGDLSRLNADYDATREAFDTLASAFAQRSQVRKERALDLHFQMVALTSVEEWSPISKREVEALSGARTLLKN